MLPVTYQYYRSVQLFRLSHTVTVQKLPNSDSHIAMTSSDKMSNTDERGAVHFHVTC